MTFLLVTLALASADPLREALQSNEGLAKLFTQYEAVEGKVYNPAETKLRFRLFRKSVQNVVDTNEQDLGWTAGLNLFSDMTAEEKQQYLGLNISLPHAKGEPLPLSDAPAALAKEIDWRKKGGVTEIKQQGPCKSGWAFAAVGSLEGVHFDKVGTLKSFAEQELLDCAYERKQDGDGCQGGWMQDGFYYLMRHQRLAPSYAVSYTGKDGTCDYGDKPNGLEIWVQNMYQIPKGIESQHLYALSKYGPLAVAFEVTEACKQYKSGIFKDTTCRGEPNHAVTVVGYNSQSFAIKNSWGGSWGDSGYIYMARNHHNCGMYIHSAVIILRPLEPEPTVEPSICIDHAVNCELFKDWLCLHRYELCRRTCKRC